LENATTGKQQQKQIVQEQLHPTAGQQLHTATGQQISKAEAVTSSEGEETPDVKKRTLSNASNVLSSSGFGGSGTGDDPLTMEASCGAGASQWKPLEAVNIVATSDNGGDVNSSDDNGVKDSSVSRERRASCKTGDCKAQLRGINKKTRAAVLPSSLYAPGARQQLGPQQTGHYASHTVGGVGASGDAVSTPASSTKISKNTDCSKTRSILLLLGLSE